MRFPNFTLSDQSLTTQNPYSGTSLGDLEGGGQRFNFGGINDSPALKWIVPALGALLLIGGGALWWLNRKKK